MLRLERRPFWFRVLRYGWGRSWGGHPEIAERVQIPGWPVRSPRKNLGAPTLLCGVPACKHASGCKGVKRLLPGLSIPAFFGAAVLAFVGPAACDAIDEDVTEASNRDVGDDRGSEVDDDLGVHDGDRDGVIEGCIEDDPGPKPGPEDCVAGIYEMENEQGQLDAEWLGASSNLTATFEFSNPRQAVELSMDISASSGTASLSVFDSDAALVGWYRLTSASGPDSLGGFTAVGVPGTWTVRIELTDYSGDGSVTLSGAEPDDA